MIKSLFNIWGIMLPCLFIFFPVKAQDDKSYLDPPQLIKDPATTQSYSAASRAFTGIPSLAVSPGGRFWSVWYAGKTPGEDKNNYVVVSTSGDKGETWQEAMVIEPVHEQVRAYDPEVWIDPEGKLWVFWAQQGLKKDYKTMMKEGTLAGVWSVTTGDPDSGEPEWNDPRRLTDGVMMCKPTVLSSGEWVLPASIWKFTDGSARMVVSSDHGENWKVRGAASVPRSVRSFDEHMIVERKDGALWMLIRTRYGIGQSISKDRGKTWTPVTPSNIQHPAARFFIRRLHSGNLLLVKHGPVDMQTGRSHLMAFISKDDGHSWSDGLLLDAREGVSYPDGQQTSDGTIYITYDYDRTGSKQILMTSFDEGDVIFSSSRNLLEVFHQRRVISKGGSD